MGSGDPALPAQAGPTRRLSLTLFLLAVFRGGFSVTAAHASLSPPCFSFPRFLVIISFPHSRFSLPSLFPYVSIARSGRHFRSSFVHTDDSPVYRPSPASAGGQHRQGNSHLPEPPRPGPTPRSLRLLKPTRLLQAVPGNFPTSDISIARVTLRRESYAVSIVTSLLCYDLLPQ